MKIRSKTPLLAVGVFAILFIGFNLLSGLRVEIVNLGPLTMKNVSVDVTGASYSVGDIPTRTRKTVKVQPQGESSVSVRHLDKSGKQRTLFVDCYIERGYSGKVTIQVENEKITHVKQNIKPTAIS